MAGRLPVKSRPPPSCPLCDVVAQLPVMALFVIEIVEPSVWLKKTPESVAPRTVTAFTMAVMGVVSGDGANRSPFLLFFFQAEDGIRDLYVTGVQTCALPI